MKTITALGASFLLLPGLTFADTCSEFLDSVRSARAPISCESILQVRATSDADAQKSTKKEKDKLSAPAIDANSKAYFGEFCRFPWVTALVMSGQQPARPDPLFMLNTHYGFNLEEKSTMTGSKDGRAASINVPDWQAHLSEFDPKIVAAIEGSKIAVPKENEQYAKDNVMGYRSQFFNLIDYVPNALSSESIPRIAYPKALFDAMEEKKQRIVDPEMLEVLSKELHRAPTAAEVRWEYLIDRENDWINALPKEQRQQFADATAFHFAFKEGGIGMYHDLKGELTGEVRFPLDAASIDLLKALSTKIASVTDRTQKCYSSSSLKKDCDLVGLAVEAINLENEKADTLAKLKINSREYWKTVAFKEWKERQDDQGHSCLQASTAEFCAGRKDAANCAKELNTQPDRLWQSIDKKLAVQQPARGPATSAKQNSPTRRKFTK